jgi:hypothetical protein
MNEFIPQETDRPAYGQNEFFSRIVFNHKMFLRGLAIAAAVIANITNSTPTSIPRIKPKDL